MSENVQEVKIYNQPTHPPTQLYGAGFSYLIPVGHLSAMYENASTNKELIFNLTLQ
jgi:hypothetical protein